MATIACLHAARSNIRIYEQALQTLEYDDIQLLHRVEASLFEQATAHNTLTPDIINATRQIVGEMCQQADAVIITCTTLGESVSDASQFSKPVLRVDATLAKIASRYHGSILVLCTAHSTLEATRHVFTAFIPGERLAVELIPRAWAFFNSGDREGYYHQIADYIQQRPECPLGCIVLAQSSMAGAEKYVNSTLAVLTGPEVSLQAAIEAIN